MTKTTKTEFMGNSKTPEEILNEIFDSSYRKDYRTEYPIDCIISAMQEYGKQQYSQAIKDAAENAKVKSIVIGRTYSLYGFHNEFVYTVDKDSILKLLKP